MLARQAGVSRSHLARVMASALFCRPSVWLMQQRLRRARNLLESSGLAVTEVAAEAGFENLSHFHRCFRAATGRTPLAYRKLTAKNVA